MSEFPTTAWTVVSRARSGMDAEAREALAFLCAAYWLPLYSFARRLGHASEDALDLTQGYQLNSGRTNSFPTMRDGHSQTVAHGVLTDGRSFQFHRNTHGPDQITALKIDFK